MHEDYSFRAFPIESAIAFALRLSAVCATVACLLAGGCAASEVPKSDEELILFPTAARLDEQAGTWLVPVHGWIFEPEEDSVWRAQMIERLAQTLDLESDQIAQSRFARRARLFLVDNERNKRIGIQLACISHHPSTAAAQWHPLPDLRSVGALNRVSTMPARASVPKARQATPLNRLATNGGEICKLGGQVFTMNPSGANGHFIGLIRHPAEEVAPSSPNPWLHYQAVTANTDLRIFSGAAQLIPPTGVSVISDIDDTIKISEVTDRRALLAKGATRLPRPI